MDEPRKSGHEQARQIMENQLSIRTQNRRSQMLAKECQEHPAVCKFCEAAAPLGMLAIHEHHCGNQAERCPDCGQLTVLRVLAQHRGVCRNEQAQRGRGKKISVPESSIYCHFCNQMIQGNKYLRHSEKCHKISASAKYSPIEEPRISPPSLPSQAAKDQTSTAEKDVRPKMKNMNRFPLLTENSKKQAPSDTNKTMDLPLKSEHKPWITSPVEDEADYDILRRCFQCGILLPLPTLNQHQEKCSWLASLKGKQVRNSS